MTSYLSLPHQPLVHSTLTPDLPGTSDLDPTYLAHLTLTPDLPGTSDLDPDLPGTSDLHLWPTWHISPSPLTYLAHLTLTPDLPGTSDLDPSPTWHVWPFCLSSMWNRNPSSHPRQNSFSQRWFIRPDLMGSMKYKIWNIRCKMYNKFFWRMSQSKRMAKL